MTDRSGGLEGMDTLTKSSFFDEMDMNWGTTINISHKRMSHEFRQF
jgi:hypothetical protein